ncbi:hypothetical protein GCK72_018577 [Caenorhabditis remanei]|uniref:Uncharacterized protein n=1 Tax=Caenorhabditis remanei TaxID=31234 RepID=A0A6A5GBH7_CAERE|nr:hypothetical protein GCK72_018577 [Caenorhabditis remanei]KAF1752023.1 hypothetical protein GCK72_018577 [Caenorhabditis remanei]
MPAAGSESTATVVSCIQKVDDIEKEPENNTNEKSETSENNENSPITPGTKFNTSGGNNEPSRRFSLSDELKNLEESAPVKEELSDLDKLKSEADIKNYEKAFEPTNEELEEQEAYENRKMKLSKEKEEQLKQSDSLKIVEESDGENEEIRRIDEEFRRTLEENERQQYEEIKRMREEREKRQKETEEDFRKMKQESQERITAILGCIQRRIRFEEKEKEWSAILKGFRDPLIKIVTSQYALQDEFRWQTEDEKETPEIIIEEVKYFAKLVCSAQNVLENAFCKLEMLSENYDDRIFLRMIMKPVSLVGHQCNSIGESLIQLLRTPLLKDSQKKFNDAVSNLDPQLIPTTTTLKNNSMTARIEDYTGMEPTPPPEWYYTFSNIQND